MSEIFVDTIKNKTGSTSLDSDKLPDMYSGSAKAWAEYNQISTSVIQSLNVSSVTDNSVGYSDVNFTNSLSAINHPAPTNQSYSSAECGVWSWNSAVSKTEVRTQNLTPTHVDRQYSFSQFGDLA